MQILTDIYCRVNDDIVLDMDCERVASTVTCSFKYTNNGKDDYYLFKRDTPLEGVINSPYIDVYSNGELLEYKGMIMLRDAPTRKDFVLLKAGKSISASISLTDAFEFPRNTIYTIQYNKPVEYIPRDRMRMSEGVSALRATTVFKSDTILILDAKSLSRPEAVDEQRPIVPGPCDNAQAYGGTITERESILKIHKKVCAILDMDPSQQLKYIRVKLYKKWFGKYHKWYINRVNTTFQYIERGLKMRTNYFIDKYNYCESQEGLIGIVWKTTGTVALCSRFFQIKNVFCNKENKRSMEGAIVNLLSQAYGNTRFITSRPEVCQRFTWLPYFAVSSSGNYEHFYCEAQNPRK